MKKVILLILPLLLLAGCATQKYTPVINEDFKISAIYRTGDFSYSCDIEKQGDTVYITPTSTRAKGLVISCNGREVTLKRKSFEKSFLIKDIDKTNPAIILYQVFTSLGDAKTQLIDGDFTYTGNCSLGKYILKQRKDNSLVSLEIPQADIIIEFQATSC